MTIIKSYTDIEQSKKLAKILPIESADMAWYPSYAKDGYSIRMLNDTYPLDIIGDAHDEIPAWSLTALLDVFPCSKESPIVNLTRGGWNPSFTRQWFATWEDEDKNVFYSCDGISPVDAVVELILKLHEQNLCNMDNYEKLKSQLADSVCSAARKETVKDGFDTLVADYVEAKVHDAFEIAWNSAIANSINLIKKLG